MGKRNSGVSGSLLLKSLKWIFRNANIPKLAIMESSLIVHWEKTKTPHDRGEALPLPLYVVTAWERRLLDSSAAGGAPPCFLSGCLRCVTGKESTCHTRRDDDAVGD